MLEGADLLAKCREGSHLSKSDLVRACGYVAERPDGQGERIKFTEFYEALLAAKGLVLKTEKRMGRKLTHQTKIQKRWQAAYRQRICQRTGPGTWRKV